jgi:hypothetical protein
MDMALPDCQLSAFEWDEYERLHGILKIPNDATVALQGAQLTPGQFSLEWEKMRFRLQKCGSPIADELVEALDFRKEKLMESNDILLSGIWADSKSRVLLSSHQKEIAKTYLKRLALLILRSDEINPSSPKRIRRTEDDDGDQDFEAYLASMAKEDGDHAASDMEISIDAALQQYESNVAPPVALIKDAIQLVKALPTTQASVERLFSALKMLVSDRRSRMQEDILNGILFLRSNKLV